MQKELIGEALKCRNKKPDAKRKKKIEQEKFEGKSLDIRDWGLEVIPPPVREEGGEWDNPLSQSSRNYQEFVLCLVRWNSWVNNSIMSSDKKSRSSASSIKQPKYDWKMYEQEENEEQEI